MTKGSSRFLLRPAHLRDAATVADLWNRRAAARSQAATYEPSDVERRWMTPGFSIETDTQLAWNESRLVAYSHLRDVKEPHVDLFVAVHLDPSVEDDQDLADALFGWVEKRARASLPKSPDGARVVLVAGCAASDVRAEETYLRRGFSIDRVFSQLRIDFDEPPAPPAWPHGVGVRAFLPGEDDAALVRAYQDAFRSHYGYLEQPFGAELERWQHWMREADFDPTLWLLATQGAEVCGFSCSYSESHGDTECGLVDEFGVRPEWRRRGIGRALLLESFGALYARGLTAAELTVDSDNTSDALSLYASVGMRSVSQSHTLVKVLRAGRNLVSS